MKVLGTDKNFLAIEKEFSNFEESKVVILPVPYEHSVSYGGGTSKGPRGILDASAYVEFYDDEFDSELCFDKKIATLPALNMKDKFDKEAIDFIYKKVKEILEYDKFVVTLGGEHTISTAPIKAHFEKFPEMSILHFDAHSDLRESYEDNLWSHASFMARVAEFFPAERITQVGIRAQCKEESIFIKENKVNTFYASAIRRGVYGDNWQKKVADSLKNQIYITFDVDYFDPSIMPSTGTPEPDGFLYSETMHIFREIRKQKKKIIGADIVELAPVKGVNHPDLTSARLLYKILNFAFN